MKKLGFIATVVLVLCLGLPEELYSTDVFIRIGEDGAAHGLAVTYDTQCFVLTAEHAVRKPRPLSVLARGMKSAPLSTLHSAEDFALLRVDGDAAICGSADWPNRSEIARILAEVEKGRINEGILKSRSAAGGLSMMPVFVKDINSRRLTIEPKLSSDRIASGLSGSVLSIDNQDVGLLLSALKQRRGEVQRLDRIMDDVEPIIGLGDTEIPPRVIPPPAPQGDIVVDFATPLHGDIVGQYVNVAYSLQGAIPAGYQAVLLIRDPLGQYWSWGSSAAMRHARVQVGMPEDTGRDFEIGVLVTNREVPLGMPMQVLPEHIGFRSIVVKRR